MLYKPAYPHISQTLKCVVRSTSILVRLLQEEIDQWRGNLKGVRDIAARIFVNLLLTPRIESFCVKSIIFIQEDLRSGHDHTDNWSRYRMYRPHCYRMIGSRPEQPHTLHACALRDECINRCQLVALSSGRPYTPPTLP